MRILFLLAYGWIFMLAACKEAMPVTTNEDQVVPEPVTSVAIPQRPSEIEVLDLTDDIDLFVVIAGSYSSPAGAKKKAAELRKAGFPNADIIQRPGSQLYSALVERFDSETLAQAFADEIAKNDEIKSYVYKLDD